MSTEAQNQVEEQVATEAVAVEAVVEEGNVPCSTSTDAPLATEDAPVSTVNATISGGEAA